MLGTCELKKVCGRCEKEWIWNMSQDIYGDGSKFCNIHKLMYEEDVLELNICDCGKILAIYIIDAEGGTVFEDE